MCPQWGEFGVCHEMSGEELHDECTVAQLKTLIDDAADFSPSLVFLSGGEPMLYEGWQETAAYIKQKGIRTCMITNASQLSKHAGAVAETIDVLHVSVDGPPEVHNKIRGSQSSFSQILSGLHALTEIKRRKNTQFPLVYLCFTVSDLNVCDLETFIRSFEGVDVDQFVFQHLLFLSQETQSRHREIFNQEFHIDSRFFENFFYAPKKFDVDEFTRQISAVREKYPNVIFHPDLTKQEFPVYYNSGGETVARYNHRCFAPFLEATVLPNGDAWLCPDYKIGNIRSRRFKDLWNSEAAQTLRTRIKQKGLFPACRSCCYLYGYQ